MASSAVVEKPRDASLHRFQRVYSSRYTRFRHSSSYLFGFI